MEIVVEGIAIGRDCVDPIETSFGKFDLLLATLHLDGVQQVQIWKIYKESIPIMFLTGDTFIKFFGGCNMCEQSGPR